MVTSSSSVTHNWALPTPLRVTFAVFDFSLCPLKLPAPAQITIWSVTLPDNRNLARRQGALFCSVSAFRSSTFTLDAPISFSVRSLVLSPHFNISRAGNFQLFQFFTVILMRISFVERKSKPALIFSTQSRPTSMTNFPSLTLVVMRLMAISSPSMFDRLLFSLLE